MSEPVRMTRIRNVSFEWAIHDLAMEAGLGFDMVYTPGATLPFGGSIAVVETDAGVHSEQVGEIDERTARYLLGRDIRERELIWHDLKRSQRGVLNAAPGCADIAIWDVTARLAGVSLWQLLGGFRTKLPCYASTYHGDENGGLTTSRDYADFAAYCQEELGYPAFKMHGWVGGPIQREVDSVLAIREAVGDGMALMLDPAGAYKTFDDVLRVGRACDEAGYFWYEDPFRAGGLSMFAHTKLREFVKTPLLMGEHVRGLETKADTIVNRATDFVRANVHMDGGVTGVLKIAAMAEAFGLDVELHGPGVAHRHLMAAIRNTNWFELGLVHPKVRGDRAPVYEDPRFVDSLHVVDRDGCVDVPTDPGLGAAIDWRFVEAHKTGEVTFE